MYFLRYRWRIDPEDFHQFYTPTEFPEDTHLLYEVHWDSNDGIWRQWCTNIPGEDAEINFLENHCEEIERRRGRDTCTVTWYLSWSPCSRCSSRIIEFLEENPHVTLEIRAARLYRETNQRNRRGLRQLVRHGVELTIMKLQGELLSLYQGLKMEGLGRGSDDGDDGGGSSSSI